MRSACDTAHATPSRLRARRESDAGSHARDHGVDADDFTVEVNQRSARVAGIIDASLRPSDLVSTG